MPTPIIPKGSDYFNAYLWSGNSTEPRSFTGVGFQPNFYWSKVRNAGSSQHILIDSVRGVNGQLSSDNTDAEDTTNFAVKLDSFDSDGFTLSKGSNATFGYYQGNLTGRNYVGWLWKAGGAAVTNTAGTISSQVSANTTSGFSIVTYTGTGSAATIGHGLGVVPSMVIVKNRDAADAWQVYHAANTANPETDYLVLNTTAATADAADRWNDTLPTSTVFSIGNGVEVNTNTEKYVAYCWAPIAGYSAFGSYVGNSFSFGTDGTFVYLGFRPRFVLVKLSSSAGYDWVLYDSARSQSNVAQNYLNPNTSNSENAGGNVADIDFLSNGFKLRNNSTSAQGTNIGNQTYIYMAFAENPFKYANAR
jgi:hypothetical protein